MAKIELTKQGKLDLINWAIRYYDRQNLFKQNEEEGVEITAINQPVDEQTLKSSLNKIITKISYVVDKLKHNSKDVDGTKLEKALSFYEDLTMEHGIPVLVSNGVIGMAESVAGVVLRNFPLLLAGLALPVGLIIIDLLFGFEFGVIVAIQESILERKGTKVGLTVDEYRRKKELDKRLIKRAKQVKKEGKNLTIEFSDDEYTYLLLKQLLHELMQKQSKLENLNQKDGNVEVK